MNGIFLFFLCGAILFAAYTGKMKEINDASYEGAKSAVQLAIGLIGVMAFWLGVVKILEVGGLMTSLARAIKPLMIKLFPDVPPEHPALGAIILNITANMLGLGNAATPMGIKAMVELDKLNPFKGVATNPMIMFLAINTSNVTILPLGVISLRAAAGSTDPAGILIPSILATTISTITAIVVATLCARLDSRYRQQYRDAKKTMDFSSSAQDEAASLNDHSKFLVDPKASHKWITFLMAAAFLVLMGYHLYKAPQIFPYIKDTILSYWLIPALILSILGYGIIRGVKVYDTVVDGARQGFEMAVRIIPYLVAILVAINMFRASGAMDLLASLINPLTSRIGLPAEVLPMALVRPLSGSGAFAVLSSIVQPAPDSYNSFLASIMMGSTETTFYVIAVYFGAAGVTQIRYAVVAALLAELVGIIASCLLANLFF
ncbi:MAG: spore maturation protein [Deltaproteobacteria bacterium]|nr:spore maturation protein [Deltaproteobacteria bacterium]